MEKVQSEAVMSLSRRLHRDRNVYSSRGQTDYVAAGHGYLQWRELVKTGNVYRRMTGDAHNNLSGVLGKCLM